jgi:hypothetical protein
LRLRVMVRLYYTISGVRTYGSREIVRRIGQIHDLFGYAPFRSLGRVWLVVRRGSSVHTSLDRGKVSGNAFMSCFVPQGWAPEMDDLPPPVSRAVVKAIRSCCSWIKKQSELQWQVRLCHSQTAMHDRGREWNYEKETNPTK